MSDTDKTETSATTKGKASTKSAPEIKYKYTSPLLDSNVPDLDEYEEIRKHEVDSQLAFLDELTNPLEDIIKRLYIFMKNPTENPYSGLRMPQNLSTVSLEDLQNLLGDVLNAYAYFGEARSIVNAITRSREILFERRKKQALANEGGNSELRVALSSMRSDPEYLLLARSEMLKEWIDQRYFIFAKMVDTIQALMTTKSIEAGRELNAMKTERYGQ